MIWSALQLTWVTMLMFVQLVQISRAMTTWENMRGAHHGHNSRASDAVTSALNSGTTTVPSAQLENTRLETDSTLPRLHASGHHQKTGCFARWKKLLGLDTFVETARHGIEGSNKHSRRSRNPFSHGCLGNCKDFWCDPAPVFGQRRNGMAMLGGQIVDYTDMYEAPLLITTRARRSGRGEGIYESVATEDVV